MARLVSKSYIDAINKPIVTESDSKTDIPDSLLTEVFSMRTNKARIALCKPGDR